jgi:hypothetical protein
MALTTTAANNKLIKFRKEVYREYVRENLFSPYMGTSINSIIRVITDLDKGGKNGGEQINIPLRARLNGAGRRLRHAARQRGAARQPGHPLLDRLGPQRGHHQQRRGEQVLDRPVGRVKPALVDWGQEKQRDEIVDGFYAVPSQAAPAGLGSALGQRVNGILFDAATAAQRNTWITDNADRILIGSGNTANLVAGNFAASMANITGAMTLSGALINRMKRSAKKANPRIRPFKLKENGTEWFVLFVGQEQFRDAQNDADIKTANQNSRAREQQGYLKNPIFVDGDLLYNGVIIREIPELSLRLPVFYQTAGAPASRSRPRICAVRARSPGAGARCRRRPS